MDAQAALRNHFRRIVNTLKAAAAFRALCGLKLTAIQIKAMMASLEDKDQREVHEAWRRHRAAWSGGAGSAAARAERGRLAAPRRAALSLAASIVPLGSREVLAPAWREIACSSSSRDGKMRNEEASAVAFARLPRPQNAAPGAVRAYAGALECPCIGLRPKTAKNGAPKRTKAQVQASAFLRAGCRSRDQPGCG